MHNVFVRNACIFIITTPITIVIIIINIIM